MAKQETFLYHTKFGKKGDRTCVNVDFKVGAGGDNSKSDVMLIQALFNFFGRIGHPRLGFPLKEMPAITGICDAKTNMAILNFQKANRHSLLSVDGVIHPADYFGRTVTFDKPLMTITLLNELAYEFAFMGNYRGGHIGALEDMVPELTGWLGMPRPTPDMPPFGRPEDWGRSGHGGSLKQ